MADWVWKGVYHWVVGCSRQLLLNKCLDPSTPLMRKVHNGGEKRGGGEEKKKIIMFIVATNVVASRLPKRRPTGTPTARANEKSSTSNEAKLLPCV